MTQHIKITTLFVLTVISVLLVGCGGTATPAPSSTENETENEAPVTTSAESTEAEETETEVNEAEEVDIDTLTLLATPDSEEYPSPPAAIPTESYPIPTVQVIDPYAEPAADSLTALDPYAEPETADVMADESSQADADVTYVRAILAADGSWTFHVTVSHPDTGESDYADGWDIVTDRNEVIKLNENDTFTRLLTHPHVNEQPFTRSQSGIVIPEGTEGVFVRAHDIVHGWGGQMVFVDFTRDEGANYVIER